MKAKEFMTLKDIVKDEEVTRFVVVAEFPEIDYTLIYRNSSYDPWVAAWGYNKEEKFWCQGHYFIDFEDAVKYIISLQNERKLNVA